MITKYKRSPRQFMKNETKMDEKWTKNGSQFDRKWTENRPKMGSKWTENGLRKTKNGPKNDQKCMH